ncbi:hypothetical protein LSAT2_015098, partial [Lamellibrachia satsuma]
AAGSVQQPPGRVALPRTKWRSEAGDAEAVVVVTNAVDQAKFAHHCTWKAEGPAVDVSVDVLAHFPFIQRRRNNCVVYDLYISVTTLATARYILEGTLASVAVMHNTGYVGRPRSVATKLTRIDFPILANYGELTRPTRTSGLRAAAAAAA